jgi:hypothetical protein
MRRSATVQNGKVSFERLDSGIRSLINVFLAKLGDLILKTLETGRYYFSETQVGSKILI